MRAVRGQILQLSKERSRLTIVHAGIFTDHVLGGDVILKKGFVQNGCHVKAFDYRAVASKFGRSAMNDALLRKAEGADILFIGKGDGIAPDTLRAVRSRGTRVALWYGDYRPVPLEWLVELLRETDFLFMTSGGDTLRRYAGEMRDGQAAFFLNPCDPDVVCRGSCHREGVLLTATPYPFAGADRRAIIRHLAKRSDTRIYGGAEYTRFFGSNRLYNALAMRVVSRLPRTIVRGDDYVRAICTSKIGIGISAVNDIPKYTSDRLSHYAALGTMILTYEFTGMRSLFAEDEIVSFRSVIELERKLERFLHDDEERSRIAENAMRRMITEYNSQNVTGMMLDIMNTGGSTRFDWVEVVG